jgi:hypothetical protein
MGKDDIFQEDDQAPLLGILPKWFLEEKSPDGKPLMSHSFRMIDLGVEKKVIYPEIKVSRAMIHGVGNSQSVIFHMKIETYLRKKFRGKFYLQKFFRECEIQYQDMSLDYVIGELNHFNAGVYKTIILGKVDLKLVFPQHIGPDKPVFELDPDQTPEEERLTINTDGPRQV